MSQRPGSSYSVGNGNADGPAVFAQFPRGLFHEPVFTMKEGGAAGNIRQQALRRRSIL